MNEAIKAFQNFLTADEGAREKVIGMKTDYEAIIAYANEMGYAFTLEDLKGLQKNEELDIEDLGDVSGGTMAAFVAMAVSGAAFVAVVSEL